MWLAADEFHFFSFCFVLFYFVEDQYQLSKDDARNVLGGGWGPFSFCFFCIKRIDLNTDIKIYGILMATDLVLCGCNWNL